MLYKTQSEVFIQKVESLKTKGVWKVSHASPFQEDPQTLLWILIIHPNRVFW